MRSPSSSAMGTDSNTGLSADPRAVNMCENALAYEGEEKQKEA